MNTISPKRLLKTSIFIVIGFLNSEYSFAQHYPLITDFGSLTGSGLALAKYNAIRNSEMELRTQIDAFRSSYLKRSLYLNSLAPIMKNKINNELKLTIERYNALVARNKSMTFLNYYKKEKVSKVLDIIEIVLVNTQKNWSGQYIANVVNGEKLNLFVNIVGTLQEANVQMDVIEDQLNNSSLLYSILQNK
jgi:hypothetical protein